jgi:hypothetical protein
MKIAGAVKSGFYACVSIAAVVIIGRLGGVEAQETNNGGGVIDLTIQDGEEISEADQIAWTDEKTRLVREIFSNIKALLDAARAEKDAIKITCLDDKLTQVHVSLKGIEERTEALRTATRAGDRTTANQNFSILRIYISRVTGLKTEAENCLGESDVVLGSTKTTMTVDENVTIEDPSRGLTTEVEVDPPEHASGYF